MTWQKMTWEKAYSQLTFFGKTNFFFELNFPQLSFQLKLVSNSVSIFLPSLFFIPSQSLYQVKRFTKSIEKQLEKSNLEKIPKSFFYHVVFFTSNMRSHTNLLFFAN